MSLHVCSFKNCPNEDRQSNCRFFHYPLGDEERWRQWIELSGNDSLHKLSKSKFKNLKVCSAHFQIDQILGSGRLISGSLPRPYYLSPNNTNNAGSVNDNVSSTGTVSSTASGPSADVVLSQRLPERDTVPPFIIVHEIIDVTIDLIDEDDVPDYAGIIAKAEYDVDGEDLSSLEEEDHGSDIVGETDAASNTQTSDYKPGRHFSDNENNPINLDDEAPEILEEHDPLAMEVEDNLFNSDELPLSTKRFAGADAKSDTLIFDDIGRKLPKNSETEIMHNFETTVNEKISTLVGGVGLHKQVTQKTYSRATPKLHLIHSRQMPCVIKQLLEIPFCLLSKNKQGEIVDAGRPMPVILYEGNLTQYTWITGSSELKKLFCWPCLLFSRNDESVHWTTLGYDYLQDLDVAILAHKNSRIHKQCSMTLSMFKNANIKHSSSLEKKNHHEEVKKNRDILQRIIDSVCLLAKLNIPFRNCEDGNSPLLHGSYLAIIKSLSAYDQLLKQQLEAPNVSAFTSSTIRDGLIIAIRTVMINKIKHEVERSKFVSIILYQTSGTIKGSQLSVVLRYVDLEGVVQERFIGYEDIGSSSALLENECLLEHVARIIMEFKIQEKLVALSYSGPLFELCSEIKEQYPKALVINNPCENQLSSIIQRACSGMKECRLYIATMADMATFFSSESNVHKLNLFTCSRIPNSSTFHFFSCLEKTVCNRLPQLLAFFKDITENPKNWSAEAVLKAQSYQCFFEDFSNTFLLVTLERVFTLTLQFDQNGQSSFREHFDKEFRDFLTEDGSKIFQIWEDVKTMRKKCNLEPEPVQMKRKKIFTYSRKPSGLEDPKYVYKLLFRKIITVFTAHMVDHFSCVKSLEFKALLNLGDAAKYRSRFPSESFAVLQNTYPALLDWAHLKCQLASLYRLIEFKDVSQRDLMLLMKMYDVENVMPEVYTLACLSLTIPASCPPKKISNSAIKRIKHLSETLGQHRMSNLALLSIENNFLSQLKELPNFYSAVLDEYASQ